MVHMSVTDFARNLRKVFDRLEYKGEEIILIRNNHQIARIIPRAPHVTAMEAMGDLYRTLPEKAGKGWVKDGRIKGTVKKEIRDPWVS